MCPGCPTFSIPIPIPKEALAAPGQAPDQVRRNGQLEYYPEHYDTREKVCFVGVTRMHSARAKFAFESIIRERCNTFHL